MHQEARQLEEKDLSCLVCSVPLLPMPPLLLETNEDKQTIREDQEDNQSKDSSENLV